LRPGRGVKHHSTAFFLFKDFRKMYRVKFTKPSVVFNSRVHSVGDVIEVSEDHFTRMVKNEKCAVETDEELTVFPEPVEPEPAPELSPEGGQGGVVTEKPAKAKR